MLKSVLKKPCLAPAGNGRRVTFCETVEIYTTERLSAPLVDTSSTQFEFSLEDLAEEWDPFASKCLILSWQDNGDDGDAFSSRQLEKPEDFLVHKVVYDSVDLKDIETPTDHDDDAMSVNEQEPDSQPYIVHQVERSEDGDETDETSSDSDVAEKSGEDSPAINETNNLAEKICELSMRNIEQHNKLLETEMLTVCEDSPKPVIPEEDVIPTIKDIGLSPPLKELSIDKLIASQSAENWLVDLDISPLSSVQETDSESNLSSEDTMIMMTSEECEKNEKRIKESFQKFELLKNLKSKDLVVEELCESFENRDEIKFTDRDIRVNPCMGIKFGNSENSNTSHKVIEVEKTSQVEGTDSDCRVPVQNSLPCDEFLKAVIEDQSSSSSNQRTTSHTRRDSVISLDTSLSDVEIPQDVREWKINLGKTVPDHNADYTIDHLDSYTMHETEQEPTKPWAQHTTETNHIAIRSERRRSEPSPIPENDCTKPDELELFVNQCTERVERIRKRYSLNEGTVWSPHRGIRPRFGSTAEIVQQIQDTQQPVYVNSHYSWPNYMSLEHESAPFCSSSLPDDFRSYPPDVICNTTHQRNYVDNDVDSDVKNVTSHQPASKHCSDIPTPFLFTFQERGTPEGASPPRLSSESLYETEAHSDSIVYYSMKV